MCDKYTHARFFSTRHVPSSDRVTGEGSRPNRRVPRRLPKTKAGTQTNSELKARPDFGPSTSTNLPRPRVTHLGRPRGGTTRGPDGTRPTWPNHHRVTRTCRGPEPTSPSRPGTSVKQPRETFGQPAQGPCEPPVWQHTPLPFDEKHGQTTGHTHRKNQPFQPPLTDKETCLQNGNILGESNRPAQSTHTSGGTSLTSKTGWKTPT